MEGLIEGGEGLIRSSAVVIRCGEDLIGLEQSRDVLIWGGEVLIRLG